jgi:membrane protein required for colicin V production
LKTLDIIILIPLIFGAFSGFKKGFLLEIVSILALILGIIGGIKLLHWGMELLTDHFDIDSLILPYLTFILLFLIIIIVINLIGKMIKKMIDLTVLGSVDNFAGSILGIFKWALGVSFLILISSSLGISLPEKYTEEAGLYHFIESLAPTVIGYLTVIFPFIEDFFEFVKSFLET